MRVWPITFTTSDRLEVTLTKNDLDSSMFQLPEGDVLDWGCSQGYTTNEIRRMFGRRAIGIDIDEGMIKYAKKYNQKEGIEFHCMDGCDLRTELPGPYAAIFAMNNLVMGLSRQITKAQFNDIFEDLRECLVPEGYLVLTAGTSLWVYENQKRRFVYSTSRDRPELNRIHDPIDGMVTNS